MDYWDLVWKKQSGINIGDNHFYYGQNGIFINVIDGLGKNYKDKSLVELGGGGANFRLLAFAKYLGATVTSVDYSDEGLNLVKEIFRSNNVNGSFINAHIEEFNPPERFNFVTHWGVIEHFKDPTFLIQKSYDLLCDDGELIFSMPNMEAYGALLWKRWSPDNWSKHVHHNDQTIESALKQSGFVNIEKFYYGIPFFKICDWETKSKLQIPVDGLQRLASLATRVIPKIGIYGGRRYSMERGFIARKKGSISTT